MASAQNNKIPPEELKIETIFKPKECAQVVEKGDLISVHYTGKLWSSGQEIDSSRHHGRPIEVKLGVGQVIKGWDEGFLGMCVNEKRILTIPSDKAYGSNGFGTIVPPNSPLVFDVELVQLWKKKDEL